MKRTLGIGAVIRRFVTAVFAVLVVLFMRLPLQAESDSHTSSDVYITVNPIYGRYRYSFDIVFYSMEFTYQLRSIAHNEETGEVYVNSGVWLMDENETSCVTLTVANHSDTPVHVTATVNDSDFVQCGVSIWRSGLSGDYLDACELVLGEEARVSEGEMMLGLSGYPELHSYIGVKTFYATVCVAPASGYATNGSEYFPAY